MKPGRKNKLIELLLHPAVLALPLALAFILLLPDIFQKYKIIMQSEQMMNPEARIEYHDLNGDEYSEWFYTGITDSAHSYITVHDSSGLIDQWNLPDFQASLKEHVITGDADGDHHLEIYPLVFRNDSLFLNSIDYRIKGWFVFRDRFIAFVKDAIKQPFAVRSCYLSDLNSDGTKEVIIPVSVGLTLRPRKIFAFDMVNDTVYESIDLGVSLDKIKYFDLDDNGTDELIVGTTASGNYHDSTAHMDDHSAYIIALNHKLELLFRPVEFPGDFNGCYNFPYFERGKAFIGTFFQRNGSGNLLKPQIQIRDIHGNLIRQRIIDENLKGPDCSVIHLRQKDGNSRLMLFMPEKGIALLDNNLEDQRFIDLVSSQFSSASAFDADGDGNDELMIHSAQPGKYYLVRQDMSNVTAFNVDRGEGEAVMYNIFKRNIPPSFSLQKGKYKYTFLYSFNTAHYWKYPLYLVIYLAVFLLFSLIHNLQRIQMKKKYETGHKMAELQLLSLRNQMDPHFTFNVLNTIGSVILQNKSDESYDMLMKFSRMIRTTINSANKICRPFEEELNFVKNYLDLQQIRHEGYFTYQIVIDPEVNILQPVPKMILQTYVENALKHGLVPRKSGGELLISMTKSENYLELSVQDNGVGRQQAKINGSTSTGVGLSILSQYYQVLNRENNNPITEEFDDLFDETGNAAGTRVVVCIPDGFVFPGVADSK